MKEKEKVLIITYYWPPGGGSGVQRWVKFAKYLPQYGVQPVILTVSNPTYATLDESMKDDVSENTLVYKSPSLEPFGLYSILSGKSRTEVAKPTTRIAETGTSLTAKAASWIRANVFVPDARIGWVRTARNKALKLIDEHAIQTVITTGPPHSTHLIGRYIKKQTSLKWIADFRDPWTKVFYNQLLPRTPLVRNIDLKLERSVLNAANEVIVVSPSMKKLQKNITDRTYRVIPNGFDHEDFEDLAIPQQQNGTFTIRHIGTLSETAIPTALFEALELLPEEFRFRMEFIGNVHDHVKELARKSRVSNRIKFTDYLPHAQAVQAMAASDLLLLVIPDVQNNELILTGKIFEYIATGKPVLMLGPAHGDAAAILDNTGQGAIFSYGDPAGLLNYLKGVIGRRQRTQSHTKDLARHPYSRIQLTRQLAELII